MPNELTTAEKHSLAKCEDVIEKGQHTFIEVGTALMEIQEGKLYREWHETFEAYCKTRWGFTRSYACRLIEAAEVVSEMLPIGNKTENANNCSQTADAPLPANEAQARELAKAPPKKRVQAMKKAAKAAAKEDRAVTAADVAEAVATIVPPKEDKPPKSGKPKFDARPFASLESYLGGALRKIDDLNRKAPHGNMHRKMLGEIKQAMDTLNEWMKAAR